MIANYHTHTFRCHHAKGEDEDYVLAAIANGVRILGFSDHAPMLGPSYLKADIRMRPELLPDYVWKSSIIRTYSRILRNSTRGTAWNT